MQTTCGLSILGGFHCLFYHTLGIWVQILWYGRQNSNHIWSVTICFRSQMPHEAVVCQSTCLLENGTEGLETQKSCKMIYLSSFILSCLCCRTIYRGVAVLVSIIKNAVRHPFQKIHIVQERKKPEAKRRQKKVQKDRNISESINVMEIKMHGHYLGKMFLAIQM